MLDSEMGRVRDKSGVPGMTQTNFRVHQDLLDALDQMAVDLNQAAGRLEYDRSKLMREILERAVEEHRRGRPAAPAAPQERTTEYEPGETPRGRR